MSDVEVHEDEHFLYVTARGGSRRERGAAIGRVVRGRAVTPGSKTYSETYGFLTATYARYEKD